MFNQIYSEVSDRVKKVLSSVLTPSTDRINDILNKSKEASIDTLEIAELLNVKDKAQFELLRDFTNNNFRQKRELREIAPVYLSSYCVDKCKYCNFSSSNTNIERSRLSLSDLERELGEGVFPSGSKVIEFTLSTDPKFNAKELSKYISRTKELLANEKGSGILLCSDYLNSKDYKRLKDSGLWGMVQWDETLDKERYSFCHEGSKRKFNFDKRIDTHDLAMREGLEVAIGCLFGLAEFKYDTLMQIEKSRYLEKEYGKKPFVFGTPRLKKSDVNDFSYELSLMAYKISEPEIGRWLQTRELPQLNHRNILDNDVYTYRCGYVKPGGYKIDSNSKGGQFLVHETEKRNLPEGFKLNQSWIKTK